MTQQLSNSAPGNELAAAFAVLDEMVAVLASRAHDAGDLVTPLVMAMVTAANARDALVTAPGFPAAITTPRPARLGLATHPPSKVADTVAEDARKLIVRLVMAAQKARDPRDRAALAHASGHVGRIQAMLSGTG
jgi:hypothetical protein